MYNLNKFKEINDTLGHQVGDEALVDFAECLRNSFGKNGFVGRMGGDEFMALLAGDVQQLYAESLSLLQQEIMAKNSRRDRKYELSVSYGSSVRASHSAEDCPGVSVRQLYSQADENMYIFKRSLAKGEKLR